MSKRISKLLSMLLAAVMVLSMAMTGLAAEVEPMSSSTDTSFTITINGAVTGETYTAYKIFDVTYDESKGNYSYTIDSDSAWLVIENEKAYVYGDPDSEVFTLTETSVSGVYNVTINSGVSDDKIIAVFTEAGVPANATVAATDTPNQVKDDDGNTTTITVTLDVSTFGPGYYFVTTSTGSLVMITTTDPAATINEKNDIPTPEKKVLVGEGDDAEEDESESVDNTKTVTYVLYANGVKGAVNLVIHDQMAVDDGVTYTFDYDNMTVYLYDGEEDTEGTKLVLNQDYVLITDSATLTDDCDFEVVFKVNDTDYDFSNCSTGAYIKVTINCTLNAGEYAFEEDEVDIPNKEKVTYGSHGESGWDTVDVYEYGFEIYKYTGETENDDGTIGTPLADAQFELTNSSGQKAYFLYDKDTSNYLLEGWGTIPAGSEDTYTSVIITDSNGKANIEGLAEGTYTLTEIKAPDGYNLLDSAISVTITADDENKDIFTVSYGDVEAEEGNHEVDVENNSGTKLPGTGGMGTTLFYIIGAVLILGAATLLITKKRLDKE